MTDLATLIPKASVSFDALTKPVCLTCFQLKYKSGFGALKTTTSHRTNDFKLV